MSTADPPAAPPDRQIQPFRLANMTAYPDRNELIRDETTLRLEPMGMQLLRLLAENHPRTTTRDEIVQRLWDGRVVTEDAISRQIAKLRQALGDVSKQARIIKTVPKVGVRLMVPVTWSVDPPTVDEPRAPFISRRLPIAAAVAAALVVGGLSAMGVWLWYGDRGPLPQLTPLTSDPGYEQDPALSANGAWLAYTSDEGPGHPPYLQVRRLADDTVVQIRSPLGRARNPSWSPSMDELAFYSFGRSDCSLAIASMPTGAVRTLGSCDRPDLGGGIGWVSSGQLVFADHTTGRPSHISLMDTRTGTLRILSRPADGAIGDGSPAVIGPRDVYFVRRETTASSALMHVDPVTGRTRTVVPDGGTIISIARETDRSLIVVTNRQEPGESVWSLELDGLRWTRLTEPGFYWGVTAAENGRLVVIERPLYQVSLWRQPIAGGEREQLTRTTQTDWSPAASPDGGSLAFVSTRNGREGSIWIRQDSRLRQVPYRPDGMLDAIMWRPDGQALMATILKAGGNDLVEINATTGAVQAVVNSPADDQGPAYSPDGRTVYFTRRSATGSDLIARQLASGRERLVLPNVSRAGVAADGTLVFKRPDMTQVWAVSPAGGEPRLVASFDTSFLVPKAWTVRGDYVWLVTAQQEAYRVSVSTGERQLVGRLSYLVTDSSVGVDDVGVVYASMDRVDIDLYLLRPRPRGIRARLADLWAPRR